MGRATMTDEHTKKSEERRRAYRDRLMHARKDGGSAPSEATWKELLGRAREVVQANHARLTGHMQAEARGEPMSPYDDYKPWEPIPPGHVAVHAETILGLEIELTDVLASREVVEQHRVSLLGLIDRARIPGPGEVDLFKLETALETGRGLPRNPEAQLLEVVRELIRWRAAVQRQTVTTAPLTAEDRDALRTEIGRMFDYLTLHPSHELLDEIIDAVVKRLSNR
jgi:hypothetical protein